MQHRHIDRRQYFKEEAVTTERYFIPYISRYIDINGGNIFEIGCGEGGNLLPFSRLGCKVTGIDVNETRVSQARRYFSDWHAEGTFQCEDILEYDSSGRQFDVVIAHDVIEHIADKEALLTVIRSLLAPGGIAFVAFPAWQMPFGGHQQIARSRILSHLPYVHLLPDRLYKSVLKIFGESDSTVKELTDIRQTRCTIEQFECHVRFSGMHIADRLLWAVNPHYETKFGLRPLPLCRTLADMPYVRNYFSTSCFYILSV